MKTLGRLLTASALLLGLMVAQAQAAPVVLADRNSTATFADLTTSAGMSGWTVNGVNQLFQQWFWFRVGATGGEAGINTLGLAASVLSDHDADGDVDTLFLAYGNRTNGLEIDVSYTLTGGLPGVQNSDIAETINIINNGSSALDMHFFQYSDFDLCGTPAGQSVTIRGGNTATQTGANCILSETVATPAPSAYEANFFANTLVSLGDGSPTTLNGNGTAGPGDVTWAFQWNTVIGAGGSYLISKDKNLAPIPEPASLLLLGSGLLGLGGAARRRLFGKKA